MNTGAAMETQRLMLVPPTEEDNEAFLKMLREDGDFTLFCGVEFSETRLMNFCGYFLRENTCFFSIFRKEDVKREFVGYVGIDLHLNEQRYEVEFYVGRQFRGHGYCTEALRKAMELLFGAGMFIDEKSVVLEKIVATTLQENEPALRLLERVGFKREQDGPAGIWMLYENPEDSSIEWSGTIVERVLKKGDLLV